MARDPYKAFAQQSPMAAAKRLLEVYSIGAKAAAARNPQGVLHTLALLRSTMDPKQSPEIALSLEAIYRDIEIALAQEEYKTVCTRFEELRALWKARIRVEERG